MRAVDRGQRLEVTAAAGRLHEVMSDCWVADPRHALALALTLTPTLTPPQS